MRPPISVGPLSEEELATLEPRYHETKDADERTPCQIVLLSHSGLSP